MAEIYQDNLKPEEPIRKGKRLLTMQVSRFTVFLVAKRINPEKLMDSYCHDIGGSDHSAWMYADAGGFQQGSCEQDEAEFSSVGEIVRANTNNKVESDEEALQLLETILERIAQSRATRAQFGEERKSPTVMAIERTWKKSGLGMEDLVLPVELIKEQMVIQDETGQPLAVAWADSKNTEAFLRDVEKRFGAEGEGWWEKMPEGSIKFNSGVHTTNPSSAKIPKINTPWEGMQARLAETAALSSELERLRAEKKREEE